MNEKTIERLYEKRADRVFYVVLGVFALVVFVLGIMVWAFKHSPENADKIADPLEYFMTGLGATLAGFVGLDWVGKFKEIKELKGKRKK